jgi:hypothetical protein
MSYLYFFNMGAIGPALLPHRGSLADLVTVLPYVVMDEIPPRRILNDVLVRGRLDAGMSGGCIWKPLELDDADFADLVRELQRRGTRPVGRRAGGKPFGLPKAPDSVHTHAGWQAFRRRQPDKQNAALRAARERAAALPGPAGEQWLEHWQAFRDRQREKETPDMVAALDQRARESVPTYEKWLEQLPVADLYLGYLTSVDTDWQTLPDSAFALPAELVAHLRPLAQFYNDWGTHTRATLEAIMSRGRRARADVRDCVDRLELPPWPFDRFELDVVGG